MTCTGDVSSDCVSWVFLKIRNDMSRPVHLIVLIHGLYGNPRHLSVPAEEIRNAAAAAEDASSAADKSQPEVVTFCCTSFAGGHTWDGIDTNAWRALEEVKQEIGRIEEDEGKDVELISFVSRNRSCSSSLS